MSDATDKLDDFFNGLDLGQQELSNCCGAPVLGETYKGFGRCARCLEMAEFKPTEEQSL